MSFPDSVLRSLFYLYRHDDGIYYRRIERLSHVGQRASGCRCRYLGIALLQNERIFLLDYESLTRNELTETILYPTYKSRVNYLTGLKIGVSAADRREPRLCPRGAGSTRPRHRPARRAAPCGLLRPDDASIRRDVLSRIDNRLPGGGSHFVGLPF